ncbi:MAG TPA: hypothetical protein VI365_26965, partial [Trebonia sp.]
MKGSPPRGATAILALAALSCAPAQSAVVPGMRGMARPLHARTAVRPSGLRRFSPFLISHTRHHRPGRGPVHP